MRAALYAGRQPLTNPTTAATTNDATIVGTVTRMPAGTPIAMEEWVSHWIAPVAARIPSIPPATDSATASPTKIASRRCRVNPSVFNTATSRVRPRIDIAMVLLETSRIAKTTAPQMLRMKVFTFPSVATNESWKACWLSVLVCCGEFLNISSIALDTGATSLAESTCVIYHPACPLNQLTDSSRYFELKYNARTGGSILYTARIVSSGVTGKYGLCKVRRSPIFHPYFLANSTSTSAPVRSRCQACSWSGGMIL